MAKAKRQTSILHLICFLLYLPIIFWELLMQNVLRKCNLNGFGKATRFM